MGRRRPPRPTPSCATIDSVLANISAVRASANVEGDTPTGAAIENRVEAQSDTARQQRLANIQAQIAADRSGAAMERSAGQTALALGQINAGTAEQNASAAHMSGMLGGFWTILAGLSGPAGSLGGGGSVTRAAPTSLARTQRYFPHGRFLRSSARSRATCARSVPPPDWRRESHAHGATRRATGEVHRRDMGRNL
jgi:anti-sigma factor RsiW